MKFWEMKKPPLSICLLTLAGAVAAQPPPGPQIKPNTNDLIRASVYADNWFMMYINGKLVAVDPIDFLPHNQVNIDILPEYPMTIAILAKDNADPATGLEYGNQIGDAGLIVRFSDGTVSDGTWKAKSFATGPLDRDIANPKVRQEPIPVNWYAVDFDDKEWEHATEYTDERVRPDPSIRRSDFGTAKFIWTSDLDLDNTVIFRLRVEKPGWTPRWNTKPDLDNTCLFPPPAAACPCGAPQPEEAAPSARPRRPQ